MVRLHIFLVADGRSPITRRWIEGLTALEYRVTLASTFPCQPVAGVQAQHDLPVAFGWLSGSQVGRTAAHHPGSSLQIVGRFRNLLMKWRYLLAPATLPFYTGQLRRLIAPARTHLHLQQVQVSGRCDSQPDLVHALRIPFEGMLAASLPDGMPLVVSIWGNDLTLHARGSAAMRRLTQRVLRRADALLADCRRDLRLGVEWGFNPRKPALALPGGGGVDLAEILRVRRDEEMPLALDLPAGVPLVVNPRGFRPGSVRTDVFFEAIPLVLQQMPEVIFACAGMEGQAEARRWVQRLKLERNVRLLPFLPQPSLWKLFQRAAASVSISSHDGTPNSLLEAMACGCFPVAGDIESLREWITPGVNGLLVEPTNPQAAAAALLLCLAQPELREAAAKANLAIIRERAEVSVVRTQLAAFYQMIGK